jgi:hypothetical protein
VLCRSQAFSLCAWNTVPVHGFAVEAWERLFRLFVYWCCGSFCLCIFSSFSVVETGLWTSHCFQSVPRNEYLPFFVTIVVDVVHFVVFFVICFCHKIVSRLPVQCWSVHIEMIRDETCKITRESVVFIYHFYVTMDFLSRNAGRCWVSGCMSLLTICMLLA